MVQKLKKQQGEATRKQILEVTARRFAQHGYHGTSLEAIAKQVGVAKSSVLWHFGSKETLLYEVIQGVMTKWEKEQTAELLAITDSRDRLSKMVDAYKLREMYKGYRAAIKLAIDLGIQDGVFRKDVSAEDVASFILAGFDGVFIQWYLDREHFDLDKATDTLRRMVNRYIEVTPTVPAEKPLAVVGPAN
jgi:AcrR family transcriptional regulator